MENQDYFFSSDNGKPKERNYLTLFIVLTILLTIVSVITTWQMLEFRNLARQESTAKTEAISAKENLLNKLKNLELEYDELSKEYEGLDSVFTKEKDKIADLMKEIKALKVATSTENYQAKVTELENRLKKYIADIDNLKIKNEVLTSENLKIKNTLDSALNKNIEIASKNVTLTDKVKAEATIKLSDMISQGIRFNSRKQEVTTRVASKAQRIKTCFSLTENMLAIKGYKIIYLRIAEPDGTILCLSSSDTFTFKGNSIVYSAKKEIYYDNSLQDVCIYWEKVKDFKKGTYYIDIFADDTLLGTSTITFE
jgi:hypothetical protein